MPRQKYPAAVRIQYAPEILAARLRRVAWFEAAVAKHGPLVPIHTAARILTCSHTRMWQLVKEGSLPVIDGMPDAGTLDRFVPLRALLCAPMPHESGKPVGYRAGKGRRGAGSYKCNPITNDADLSRKNADL